MQKVCLLSQKMSNKNKCEKKSQKIVKKGCKNNSQVVRYGRINKGGFQYEKQFKSADSR